MTQTPTLQLDIHSSDAFITKFCNIYKFDQSKPLNEIFTEFLQKINLIKVTKTNLSISVSLDKLKLGDNIRVTYLPLSQKYIDFYNTQTISGKIIYIDNENDDLLVLSIKNNVFTIHSLERIHCSYYDDNRGYMYNISFM